jgi:hypothetical protein
MWMLLYFIGFTIISICYGFENGILRGLYMFGGWMVMSSLIVLMLKYLNGDTKFQDVDNRKGG